MKQHGAESEREDSRSFDEQRLAMRVAVAFEATFSIVGWAIQSGRISEISRSGVRLLSLQQLPLGAALSVTFEPSMTPTRYARDQVNVTGRVVRLVKPGGPPYEYGIEVAGDRETRGVLQRTVLQLSVINFNNRLAGNGTLNAPSPVEEKPKARNFDERRRFMRVAVDFEARFVASGRMPEAARVTELSRTGLHLLSDKHLPVGSFIEVSFEPSFATPTGGNRRVCVRGRVARLVREDGPPFEHGVEVISDLETECTLQWAVLQVGLKAASKRTQNLNGPPMRLR